MFAHGGCSASAVAGVRYRVCRFLFDSAVLRGTAASRALKSEVISFQDLKRSGLLLANTVWLWNINSSLTPGIVRKSDCLKLLKESCSCTRSLFIPMCSVFSVKGPKGGSSFL